jgi:hypothetical protein
VSHIDHQDQVADVKMNKAQTNRKTADKKRVASLALGLLGITDSITIALFLTSTLSAIESSASQTLQNYMITGTTSIIDAALIYGSYMIMTKNPKKGAKMNIAAGFLQTGIYVYYSWFFQPSLLNWINPAGIILLLPSLLSGLIAQF